MNKTQLLRYFEALHFELEREFTGFPEDLRGTTVTMDSLKSACKELEQRLLTVPNGEESVANAKYNALHADPRFFVTQ
jgi:hypothetical protein